jgi:hypothetical protein
LDFAVYFFLFNLICSTFTSTSEPSAWSVARSHWDRVGTLPAGWLARKIGLRPLLACLPDRCAIAGGGARAVTWEPAQIALAFLAGLAMCIWGVCFLPTRGQAYN